MAAKSSPITSLRPTQIQGFAEDFAEDFAWDFAEDFAWDFAWDFGEHFGGRDLQVGVSRFLGQRPFFEAVVCFSRSSSVFGGRRPFFEVVIRFVKCGSRF